MLEAGQQIGAYRIVAQVGSGGMATVYRAHHERLERDVAIKIMHQAFQQDPNFHTRFAREAKIIARMEHPNIISVYDYAEYEGQPYLVMKFVEGRTLKYALIKQKPTHDDILRLMTPLANALDYAHKMGILHRDIKPSNIIIDPNGTPYLTDFGMARIAQTGESTISADMMLGTPQYIAPEQALGKQDLDARTDLYSFGVVLYEMIVGQVPFSGDTPYAVIHDHIYRPLPAPSSLNPDVSPQVEQVLIKALEKDPAARYASAHEMIDALRAAFAGVGATIPKSGTDAPLRVPTSTPSNTDAPSRVPTPIRDVSAPAVAPIPPSIPSPAPKRTVEFKLDLGSEDIPTELRKAGDELRKAGKEIGAAIREVGDEIRKEFVEDEQPRRKAKNDEAAVSWSWSQRREELRARDEGRDWGEWANWSDQPKDDDNLKEMPADEESYLRRRIKKRHDARAGFIGHAASYFGVNGLLWMIFFFAQGGLDGFPQGEFPWPMLVSLFWGAGFLAHAAETYFSTGERAAKRDRATLHALRERFGPDWYNIANKKQYKEIRRRVTARSRGVQDFWESLGAYIGVNGGLWAIYLITNDFDFNGFPWPMFVSFFWGLAMVGSGISAFLGGRNQKKVEGEIERELDRELSYAGEKPKRKNEIAVRLTDDGELTDSTIEEMDQQDAARRRGR
jgi:serine/threonine protein kinase